MTSKSKRGGESKERPSGNAKPKNRRYPRDGYEIAHSQVGRYALETIAPHLAELREQALADLGGRANVSALRSEVLELGLIAEAVAVALVQEIESKATDAVKRGRKPHISRYKATSLLPLFLGSAARHFNSVGLKKKRKPLTIQDYLDQRREGAADATESDDRKTAEQPSADSTPPEGTAA